MMLRTSVHTTVPCPFEGYFLLADTSRYVFIVAKYTYAGCCFVLRWLVREFCGHVEVKSTSIDPIHGFST